MMDENSLQTLVRYIRNLIIWFLLAIAIIIVLVYIICKGDQIVITPLDSSNTVRMLEQADDWIHQPGGTPIEPFYDVQKSLTDEMKF